MTVNDFYVSALLARFELHTAYLNNSIALDSNDRKSHERTPIRRAKRKVCGARSQAADAKTSIGINVGFLPGRVVGPVADVSLKPQLRKFRRDILVVSAFKNDGSRDGLERPRLPRAEASCLLLGAKTDPGRRMPAPVAIPDSYRPV